MLYKSVIIHKNRIFPYFQKKVKKLNNVIIIIIIIKIIEAQRPDLVVLDKKERSCKIIDFAVPGDSRIEEKEKDKIEKYPDLGWELLKIWNIKVKIIALVVGALGVIPKQFGNRLKHIGITAGAAQFQKTVLLGTARILRKVLEI